jgi:hypothetical protein
MGGLISFYVTRRVTHYSLLFNASLYIVIGLALVVFLVKELHVSVSAVLTGSWMWGRIFMQLEKALRAGADRNRPAGMEDLVQSDMTRSQHLSVYYDSLHEKNLNKRIAEKGIDGSTLFAALREVGIQISRTEVDVLIEKADVDGNDRLSKDEWLAIASRTQKH